MTKSPLKEYNWLWFAQGYINATVILLENLLSSEIPGKKTDALWLPPSGLQFVTIPIFYNVRHIFELVIKTTKTFKNKEINFVHDKQILLKELTVMYGEKNKISTRFVEIVEKYYSKEFYEKIFGVSNLPDDPLNTLFRFPEDKQGKNHVDPSIFARIDKQAVREIKSDVEELDKILLQFYGDYRKPFYEKFEHPG